MYQQQMRCCRLFNRLAGAAVLMLVLSANYSIRPVMADNLLPKALRDPISMKAFRTPLVPEFLRAPYDPEVEKAAKRNHIDSNLLRAVITAESGYKPHERSAVGAQGLMQLMPGTARHFGVHNLHDPKQNIEAGARYIRHLLDLFDSDIKLAIAAYNAGEGTVIRSGYKVPQLAETRAYVPRVLSLWQRYRKLYLTKKTDKDSDS